MRRQRLVAAAAEQFHRRGVPATALADVARGADVPPGNMFYYFRTKDALAEAVVADWTARIEASLGELEAASADPRERLGLLLERAAGRGANYAAYGCPLAGIARDLRQMGAEPALAAAPLKRLTAWVERQLGEAGDGQAARHALFVVAALQGAFVLAHASDEAAVVDEVRRSLDAWLAGDVARRAG
ncbi:MULTISPECIES: TetR/AcrR family transcriptional regulator [Sphingomonas]|uniref:TetR/AcrR family transcriptional regulator n=1 Tax=Sphingomonas TaxID=13687 RepID=UPI0013B44E52|nr:MULTISPECIES: TetR/AcrR family transcriptional regulator [Sphingomonas]